MAHEINKRTNARNVSWSGERTGRDEEVFITPWTISSGSESARRYEVFEAIIWSKRNGIGEFVLVSP